MKVAGVKVAGVLLSTLAVLAGCGSPADDHLVIFAAASLRPTFADLDARFSALNPGSPVELSTAGSADLLTQLTQGAQADVFATADTATMDKAARAGLLAGPPVPFASNALAIVVAPGNPQGVTSFRDLAGVDLVVCAVQVPCGAALPRIEQETGVRLRPVSEESSVTDVLNKVTSGQADAGVVYQTDARAAGAAVTTVPFPEAAGAPNRYQIAVLISSADPVRATAFVDLVAGPVGQQVLGAAGFGGP